MAAVRVRRAARAHAARGHAGLRIDTASAVTAVTRSSTAHAPVVRLSRVRAAGAVAVRVGVAGRPGRASGTRRTSGAGRTTTTGATGAAGAALTRRSSEADTDRSRRPDQQATWGAGIGRVDGVRSWLGARNRIDDQLPRAGSKGIGTRGCLVLDHARGQLVEATARGSTTPTALVEAHGAARGAQRHEEGWATRGRIREVKLERL